MFNRQQIIKTSPTHSTLNAVGSPKVVNEYCTSKQCHCGAYAIQKRKNNTRLWYCEHEKDRVYNKDFSAAFAICKLGLTLLLTGKRLEPFATPSDKSAHAQRTAGQTANSAPGSPEQQRPKKKKKKDQNESFSPMSCQSTI